MVNVEQAIISKYPNLQKYPKVLIDPFVYFAKKLMYQDEINSF